MTAAGREPHHRALLARVVPLRAGCAALAAVEARLPRGPTPAVPPPGTGCAGVRPARRR